MKSNKNLKTALICLLCAASAVMAGGGPRTRAIATGE